MKKFISLLCIFLFLSFNINNLTVMASPINLTLSEGIYNIKDLKLIENTTYTVQNNSPGTVYMIIIDSNNEQIIESKRLIPNSIKYTIGPFKYDNQLVVLGHGTITITE